MKFRKKPIIVDAYQITRELLEDWLFKKEPYPAGLNLADASYHPEQKKIFKWTGYVYTIHGQKTYVIEGDWIITEPDGIHHYPCKPDIFENTFERTFNDDHPLPGYRREMGNLKILTAHEIADQLVNAFMEGMRPTDSILDRKVMLMGRRLETAIIKYAALKVIERDKMLKEKFEQYYPNGIDTIRIESYRHAIEFCFENADEPDFD